MRSPTCRRQRRPRLGLPLLKIWRGFASTSWIFCSVIEPEKYHERQIWIRLEQNQRDAVLAVAACWTPDLFPAPRNSAEWILSAAYAADGKHRQSGGNT